MSKHFNVAVDADGIALVTMDSPGRSMNVLGPDVETELAGVLPAGCDVEVELCWEPPWADTTIPPAGGP